MQQGEQANPGPKYSLKELNLYTPLVMFALTLKKWNNSIGGSNTWQLNDLFHENYKNAHFTMKIQSRQILASDVKCKFVHTNEYINYICKYCFYLTSRHKLATNRKFILEMCLYGYTGLPQTNSIYLIFGCRVPKNLDLLHEQLHQYENYDLCKIED